MIDEICTYMYLCALNGNHQTHSLQSSWKVSLAKAIYSILKRMHRAARIPDDDAEALQIGARGSGKDPMLTAFRCFTPQKGDPFWQFKYAGGWINTSHLFFLKTCEPFLTFQVTMV